MLSKQRCVHLNEASYIVLLSAQPSTKADCLHLGDTFIGINTNTFTHGICWHTFPLSKNADTEDTEQNDSKTLI